MKRTVVIAAAALLLCALPAAAWGPRAQSALVSSGANLMKRDGIALNKLLDDVRNGAALPTSELATVIPLSSRKPVAAIESEIFLLQAVRGEGVDPYLAYRLGVLGKLVTLATAPLRDADPSIRNKYWMDVEANIQGARISDTKRQLVDAPAYFPPLQREIDSLGAIIEKEYQSGVGFRGVAETSLDDLASKSTRAVADVYFTVLRGSIVMSDMSRGQIRDYYVSALEYYIGRGDAANSERTYNRLMESSEVTPDLQKSIGDLFYEARMYERAIQEYRAVLVAEPSRRDVAERISEYYVQLGDDLVKKGGYDEAVEAYESALAADRLHATVVSKLQEARALVREREARLMAAQEAVTLADDLLRQAEVSSMEAQYGQAMTALYDARMKYAAVTEEFPTEYQNARIGLQKVEIQLSRLQSDLINYAPSLSGRGTLGSIKQEASNDAKQQTKAVLKSLLENQYQQQLEEVERNNAGRITDSKS